jgi:excisionase family DNA binding protein
VQYLTYSQVAELLAVSVDTVEKLVKAGRLRAVNVGSGTIKGRYRIPQDSLEEFLIYREVQPATAPARRQRREKVPNVTEYF